MRVFILVRNKAIAEFFRRANPLPPIADCFVDNAIFHIHWIAALKRCMVQYVGYSVLKMVGFEAFFGIDVYVLRFIFIHNA